MPWTPHSFASRHNHSLTPPQAAHAARIANAILRSGAPEGTAIAVANHYFQHRDAGGGVDPTQAGVGGITPSAQSMAPLQQGLVQQYASLPTEKLQEMAARAGGSPQGQIIRSVLQRKLTQPNAQPMPQPQQQAAPAPGAPNAGAGFGPPTMRRGGAMPHRDLGGANGVPLSMASPWWTRSEARGADQSAGGGGFLAGTTGGRADAVKTQAPAGSYVLPADVVAGLGDGNSLAGARVWDEILRSGPWGTPQARPARGMGAPRAPSARGDPAGFRAGGVNGGAGKPQPVALSHGEIVVSDADVRRIGRGDMKAGWRELDRFVLEQRKKYADKLRKLPGPVGAKRNAKSA